MIEDNEIKKIPLLESAIHIIYRCTECATPITVSTKILNFLINKKMNKPNECYDCKNKRGFEPVYEESYLINSFQDPSSLRSSSHSTLNHDATDLQYQVQKVLQAFSERERLSGTVKDDDLIDELMRDQGISKAESMRLIGELMRDGKIYSPKPGYYQRTS